MINVCEICNKTFESRKARTCSKSCGDKRYHLLHKEEAKLYRTINKDKFKAQRAEHYRNNTERERANCHKWYVANRESEIAKNLEYRKQNRELFDWYHNKDRFGGVRQQVLEKYDNQCIVCQSSNVAVHHKDGSGKSRQPLSIPNNSFDNLIVLCKSCHTRLHRWQVREKQLLFKDEDIVRTIRRLIEART